jgi:hypothetical protein
MRREATCIRRGEKSTTSWWLGVGGATTGFERGELRGVGRRGPIHPSDELAIDFVEA